MSSAPVAPFTSRHVQLVRALMAAAAAAMVTFSSDKSYVVGLTVFSGFVVTTALVLAVAAFLVDDRTRRPGFLLLAGFDLVTGIVASIQPLRSVLLLFVLLIVWAAATGIAEFFVGFADRRAGRDRPLARDAMFVGVLGVVLAVAVAFVSPDYTLDYFIKEAGQTFTLSGQIIMVGLFGGYTAILAVYLAIAGFTPRHVEPAAEAEIPTATHHEKDHA
ncbi:MULTISPECIES: hypothetical protein [unclassified Microbacterium]|uniref:hypothetical protein n=1 Tax=unclassified Microbacterium TaxID=2609290 RepID=UPI00097ECCDB|nr:hypothetical protein [Microbacterium sp. JB110]RCS60689.1 acyl-CoA synthetase [Microbacterium sp. JB110]SJM44830.1 putative membrane protein [Frigoribacterium sp. JB110]